MVGAMGGEWLTFVSGGMRWRKLEELKVR
jgi:hypothetical protein